MFQIILALDIFYLSLCFNILASWEESFHFVAKKESFFIHEYHISNSDWIDEGGREAEGGRGAEAGATQEFL
jgi:hypothetical protein